ncbi:hypothetical protein PIB30_046473 [Stylosanthes scabra]|uniref:Uncharacterized protein n=1 Tax=Stylosanthes scabra TaxID=79078 RepID=A0ABU6TH58_9FABA|nr:hypothetical protein [Stylosanthes scabra]
MKDQDIINHDSVRIYRKRAPKSLFGEVLLAHTHLSHKPPTFRLGTTGYAGSPKPLEATGSGNINAELGGTQNGQPPPRNPTQGNRQSAFDRIGPSRPNPRPFGGTGSDESQIAQELRHRMQAMESGVRELRKENAELRSSTKDPQPRTQTSPRRRSRSQPRSPPRRNQRPKSPPQAKRTQRPHTPQGGDGTTAARATATPPREEIATHEGGPTGDTKEPEIGMPPCPLTATLHSLVGF